MRHILVTNDFPPKLGGIQSYLWELWRRLDPFSFTVLTASHPAAGEFDRSQPFPIERMDLPVLVPGPSKLKARWSVEKRARELVRRTQARLVVLDPALPLGLIGGRLGAPYALVLHGAEVTVPASLPVLKHALSGVLARSSLAICAGTYPQLVAERAAGPRMPKSVLVPPGVDIDRFRPMEPSERRRARVELGLPAGGPLVVSVSRLVPRKGMDVLVEAAAILSRRFSDLVVAIGGDGRERANLAAQVARSGAPVRLMGSLSDADLARFYGCADVFAMACRNRWGGLEQEGFGIVFLEAAACGIPQVAGRSGGSAEAVEDRVTGFILDRPESAPALAASIGEILAHEELRRRMGEAARRRAEREFDYDVLADRLGKALDGVVGVT